MKTKLVFALVLLLALPVAAAARVGDAAPNFTATDSYGHQHSLAEYKGKFVVLEWHNQGMPVHEKALRERKHAEAAEDLDGQRSDLVHGDLVGSGRAGLCDGCAGERVRAADGAAPTAVLLDPSGDLGHLYGAKTTPHMFVINPQGQLIYEGAIDDKPTPEQSDIAGATNYVTAALEESMAGKPVLVTASRPYGCSVKYAH